MKYLFILLMMGCVLQVSAQSHTVSTEQIALNKGKKWKVPGDMMKHLKLMEQDLASFQKSGQKDYASLSKSLTKRIDLLTSNCTMKGQGHDELHKWLVPFISEVKLLSDMNGQDAFRQTEKLHSSFRMFHQYFE